MSGGFGDDMKHHYRSADASATDFLVGFLMLVALILVVAIVAALLP